VRGALRNGLQGKSTGLQERVPTIDRDRSEDPRKQGSRSRRRVGAGGNIARRAREKNHTETTSTTRMRQNLKKNISAFTIVLGAGEVGGEGGGWGGGSKEWAFQKNSM